MVLPTYGAPPTNARLPLVWKCDAEWEQVPGFSPSTFFPSLVTNDGSVLAGEWQEVYRARWEEGGTRVSIWMGEALPADTTVQVSLAWDGYCALQSSLCLPEGEPSVDCDIDDSCCYLDDALGEAAVIQSLETGAGPDEAAPGATDPQVGCVLYFNQNGDPNHTVAQLASTEPSDPDVFEIRIVGRRETEPESAERELLLEIRTGSYESGALRWIRPADGPLGRIDGAEAMASHAGVWLLRRQDTDWSGNVGPFSGPVRFVYPDDCPGAGGTRASSPPGGSGGIVTPGGDLGPAAGALSSNPVPEVPSETAAGSDSAGTAGDSARTGATDSAGASTRSRAAPDYASSPDRDGGCGCTLTQGNRVAPWLVIALAWLGARRGCRKPRPRAHGQHPIVGSLSS